MKVLLSGGGTGGHIYPALALIDYIKEQHPETEFLYVGTKKGLESKIVPDKDIPFETIEIQGFRRTLSMDNVKTVTLFIKGIKESKKIIKEFKPDIVIGTGGYVCAPIVYAAHKLKIPTLIHEQNSVAGMTNKFLSRYVDKIGICFPDVATDFPKEKVVLVGNPRAQEVANVGKSDVLMEYGLEPSKKTVVIFGGSRGALTINNGMKEALPLFEKEGYQTLYASGNLYYDEVSQLAENMTCSHVKVVPYIKNMEHVLANVDLVVGRAGATSLAEITALGLPSILIPSPNVTNDHQTKNANSLVQVNAAKMIRDSELTGAVLVKEVNGIMNNNDVRQEMAKASKEQGIPDASQRIYQLIESLTS